MIDYAREVDDVVPFVLNPGEAVLWKGHCLSRMGQQRKAAPASMLPAGLLTFVLTASVAISTLAITRMPFVAMGAMFLTFFLGLRTFGALFEGWGTDHAMYCRKQTVFVLTNQRAMVLRNCRTASPVQSLRWDYADEVRVEGVKADGRGSVQFLTWDAVERRWVRTLRFFIVGNAQSVVKQAIAARDAARG